MKIFLCQVANGIFLLWAIVSYNFHFHSLICPEVLWFIHEIVECYSCNTTMLTIAYTHKVSFIFV